MAAAELAGVTWRKSRHRGQLGNCVEAAVLGSGEVAMRNSHDPDGPALIFTRDKMVGFLAGAKDGEFDDVVRASAPGNLARARHAVFPAAGVPQA